MTAGPPVLVVAILPLSAGPAAAQSQPWPRAGAAARRKRRAAHVSSACANNDGSVTAGLTVRRRGAAALRCRSEDLPQRLRASARSAARRSASTSRPTTPPSSSGSSIRPTFRLSYCHRASPSSRSPRRLSRSSSTPSGVNTRRQRKLRQELVVIVVDPRPA
jgi:hypothetical protein